jgi:hypothetical protein
VTLSDDTAGRGGIVDINGVELVPNFPAPKVVAGTPPPECLKNTAPEYANWLTFGSPDCWCFQRQCRGDGDGLIAGPFWVSPADLTAFRDAFNKFGTVGLPRICYDLNHAAEGPFRTGPADLTTFRLYFNKFAIPDVPVCDMTNYNFWTN